MAKRRVAQIMRQTDRFHQVGIDETIRTQLGAALLQKLANRAAIWATSREWVKRVR